MESLGKEVVGSADKDGIPGMRVSRSHSVKDRVLGLGEV
jgi:hypothetical protein